MLLRIIAITFIYLCTTAAWFVLGGTVIHRTQTQDEALRYEVGQLWGTVQRQMAPGAWFETHEEKRVERVRGGETITETQRQTTRHGVPVIASDIRTHLDLEHRKKGLLWYPTYKVTFDGAYVVQNTSSEHQDVHFLFTFPAQGATYDDFHLLVDRNEIEDVKLTEDGLEHAVGLPPGGKASFRVKYVSRGMEQWWYGFGQNVSQVKNFNLVVTTDFGEVDFPQSSISPTSKIPEGDGWKLAWDFNNLLTGVEIGVSAPQKLNPGPWVSQVSFSAPVSMFLFFFLLFFITTIRKVRVHPMNYFFIGAAFFSFHLLLAYLVDHVSVHTAFFISSVVSVVLVVSYMRLVVGARFALLEVGVSQFVYLVFFSYTFFFKGWTGLAVTILCIATLFIVMQVSGRVDWEEVFRRQKPVPASSPVPRPAPAA